MKTKKSKEEKYMGVIDNTWTEVDLSGFLKDNPMLINDLKRKYKL